MKNHFREIEQPRGEDHPIDEIVRRRSHRDALHREMKAVSEQIVEALGDDGSLWIQLEALLNEYRQHREEAFFNVGFEHGVVQGRLAALRMVSDNKPGEDYLVFVERIRDLAVQSELPAATKVAAVCEAAWASVLDIDT
ncbi:MAG: hypothetical protein GY854_25080 [Deltaproteobacteria bacterium]|nr:hypothetical protein [Deltaproteobacteria bacterium]